MDYEKALFIGGSADGERREVVAGIPSIDVYPPIKAPTVMSLENAYPVDKAFKVERYTRQKLRGERADFIAYVADGVDAMAALIDGYRRK